MGVTTQTYLEKQRIVHPRGVRAAATGEGNGNVRVGRPKRQEKPQFF